MADPRVFSRRIKAIADGIPRNTSVAASEAALRILSVVIPATPVDTGRARGNWQVSVGAPITRELPNKFDKTGQTTLAEARSTLQFKQPGATIYITNNLNYIQRLNEGYSAQAPAGFVEQAIRVALQGIRNVRIVR